MDLVDFLVGKEVNEEGVERESGTIVGEESGIGLEIESVIVWVWVCESNGRFEKEWSSVENGVMIGKKNWVG